MKEGLCIQCGQPTLRQAFIGSTAKAFCKPCSDFNREKDDREKGQKSKEVRDIIVKSVKSGLLILL